MVENPNPWIDYQPHRNRDKEFHDVELRDGTIVLNCYPNGVHWNHWLFGKQIKYMKPIADYRVVRIRRSHPDPFGTDDWLTNIESVIR